MKNTLIIILSILLILGAWYVFKPVVPSDSELKLIHQRDSLILKFNRIQAGYDLEELKNKRLTAELLKSKAVVKRSEDQLNKAKDKEKVYLKRIKEQTRLMSEIEADSVIKERFKDDPDSIPQKVVFELARLEGCDSVRIASDSVLQSYRTQTLRSDSVISNLSTMNQLSREQISVLQISSSNDRQLIDIKTKENKKLRRGKRLAIVLVPVAFLVGVLLNR